MHFLIKGHHKLRLFFICCRHSAGCPIAVDSYFEAPERVAALILVAPAIFAPRPVATTDAGDNRGKEAPTTNFLGTLVELTKGVIRAILRVVTGMANMLNSLYKKALAAFLRSFLGVMLVSLFFSCLGFIHQSSYFYMLLDQEMLV